MSIVTALDFDIRVASAANKVAFIAVTFFMAWTFAKALQREQLVPAKTKMQIPRGRDDATRQMPPPARASSKLEAFVEAPWSRSTWNCLDLRSIAQGRIKVAGMCKLPILVGLGHTVLFQLGPVN